MLIVSESDWDDLSKIFELLSSNDPDLNVLRKKISRLCCRKSSSLRCRLVSTLVDQCELQEQLVDLSRRQRENCGILIECLTRILCPTHLAIPEYQHPEFFLHLGLTPRQSEVLSWIVEGKRDQEIAEILGVSVRTVHSHVSNVLEKLHCENRTAAARVARRQLG